MNYKINIFLLALLTSPRIHYFSAPYLNSLSSTVMGWFSVIDLIKLQIHNEAALIM